MFLLSQNILSACSYLITDIFTVRNLYAFNTKTSQVILIILVSLPPIQVVWQKEPEFIQYILVL